MGIQTPSTFGIQKSTFYSGKALKAPTQSHARPQRDTVSIQGRAEKPEGKTIFSALEYDPDRPVLAIVDTFNSSRMAVFKKEHTLGSRWRIEHPTNGMIAHGHVVEGHARKINPKIQAHRIQVPTVPFSRNPLHVQAALKTVLKDLDAGVPINGVNLSLGEPAFIKQIAQDLKIKDLTGETIDQHREFIKKHLRDIKLKPEFETITGGLAGRPVQDYTREVIDLLEQIARRVPVYIAGGNSGPNRINLFSLAKGVTTVGASELKPGRKDKKGNNALVSANNALVKAWAESSKRFIPVLNDHGKLAGLTLDNLDTPQDTARLSEQEISIPMEHIHMLDKLGKWWNGLEGAQVIDYPIQGTSFAAPQVAAKEITSPQRFSKGSHRKEENE